MFKHHQGVKLCAEMWKSRLVVNSDHLYEYWALVVIKHEVLKNVFFSCLLNI